MFGTVTESVPSASAPNSSLPRLPLRRRCLTRCSSPPRLLGAVLPGTTSSSHRTVAPLALGPHSSSSANSITSFPQSRLASGNTTPGTATPSPHTASRPRRPLAVWAAASASAGGTHSSSSLKPVAPPHPATAAQQSHQPTTYSSADSSGLPHGLEVATAASPPQATASPGAVQSGGSEVAAPPAPATGAAAPSAAAGGAADATGAAAAGASGGQSEYVEEFETVYETESEERGAPGPPAVAAAVVAPGAEAAAGQQAAGAAAAGGAGVGSTLAEAAAVDGVKAIYRMGQLHAAAGSALVSLPYGVRQTGYGSLPAGGTTVGGWALAAALLLAIRLSRESADAERADLQALQARQAEGRQLDAELRAKRRAYLEEERRRLEEEAVKRMAEAKARQEEEARAAAERQRLYQEEAAREAQRMQEAQQAARRVYEEREARLAEELAARAEVERRLREEAEARKREEAEAKKRADAEAAQRAAEIRAAAAAAEAAQRAAEAAARREAERRLMLASTWFTLGFRGRVTGRPAPPGTLVPPALPTAAAGAGAAAAGGSGSGSGSLLRGPVAARLLLDCSMSLSYVARTAPTLPAERVVLAAVAAGSMQAPDPEEAAVVAAAAADGAAAAATLTVSAGELAVRPGRGPQLPPEAEEVGVRGGGGGGNGANGSAEAAAMDGSSGRPYESAAAAVEGAVELAGGAAAPLAQLLLQPGWLAGLPLRPAPGEALRRSGTAAGAGGGGGAASGTGSATQNSSSNSSSTSSRSSGSGDTGGAASSGSAAGQEGERAAESAVADEAADALVASELRHWARVAHLQLLSSGRQLCCQLAPLLGPGEQLEQEFECRLSRQVVPRVSDLPASAAAVVPPSVASCLAEAAAAVADGRLQAAVDLLDGAIGREEAAAAAAGRDGAANGAALPPLAVAALLYGELMEVAGYVPPPAATSPSSAAAADAPTEGTGSGASRSDSGGGEEVAAPPPAEGAAGSSFSAFERLARYQLSERAKAAPPDSLVVTVQMLRQVLPGGGSHPVVRLMDRLAEANMSLATRQTMQIRRQRAALEAQAAAVLEQQRGGGGGNLVVGPGGAAAARGSLVPAPERLWASRNVANNLLRFGEPLQVGEAVSLLEEAVSVARRHYGPRHPAQLAVLLDLLDALAAAAAIEAAVAAEGGGGAAAVAAAAGQQQQAQGQGQQPSVAARRAKAAGELLEIVQALCERYQSSRDTLSCVLLLEAAGAELAPAAKAGGSAGVARSLSAAVDEARQLVYSLRPPEARLVMTARRDGELPKLLRRLARDFTEELGAYAAGKRNRWLDGWSKGGGLPPLRP